jgi:hypothetical protein
LFLSFSFFFLFFPFFYPLYLVVGSNPGLRMLGEHSTSELHTQPFFFLPFFFFFLEEKGSGTGGKA